MKQLISLLFLSIFFLFQYGKMVAYMECRIAAAIESKVNCSCEEKLSTAYNQLPASQPTHEHHLKNYTEEFFDHDLKTITDTENIISRSFISPCKQDQLPGHLHGLLQPPRI